MPELITKDPSVCAGKPHIAGTRISVELIQDHASAGYSEQQIQQIYPHLSLEQIRAALDFGHSSDSKRQVSLAG